MPKYVLIYDGAVIGMDDTVLVNIKEALGHKFDYEELMRGE